MLLLAADPAVEDALEARHQHQIGHHRDVHVVRQRRPAEHRFHGVAGEKRKQRTLPREHMREFVGEDAGNALERMIKEKEKYFVAIGNLALRLEIFVVAKKTAADH